MKKKGKHAKSGGFQVGHKALLKSTEAGARANKGKDVHPKSVVQRGEIDRQLSALRERSAASNFKKQPQSKVVLAAPIFDLPTKQELLLRPAQHPMDMLMLDVSEIEKKDVKSKVARPVSLSSPPVFHLQPGFLSSPRLEGLPCVEEDEYDL